MATALARFRLRASGRIGIRTRRSGRGGEPGVGEARGSRGRRPGRRPAVVDSVYEPRALVLNDQSRSRPEGGDHLVEVIDDPPAQVLPVVEPRAAAVAVVEVEPERPDQPEHRPGRDARPTDRAGVGRDLGLDQDDVEPGPVDRRRIVAHGRAARWAVMRRSSRVVAADDHGDLPPSVLGARGGSAIATALARSWNGSRLRPAIWAGSGTGCTTGMMNESMFVD